MPIADTAINIVITNYITEQYNMESKRNYRKALEKIHTDVEKETK
jgi:hypothetical protein